MLAARAVGKRMRARKGDGEAAPTERAPRAAAPEEPSVEPAAADPAEVERLRGELADELARRAGEEQS